jgi:hypothetical protein
MSTENANTITHTPASAAIVANRFLALSGGDAQHVGTSGGDAVAVSAESSANLSLVAIATYKLDGSKLTLESGAAVAKGARIMSDGTGRAITAAGATARELGVALSASGAAGEMITVLAQKAAGEFVA